MTTIPQAVAIALQHHQAGRLAEAERIYRQILDVDPSNADALHLSGVIAHQQGNHEKAVELICRAIEVQPGNPAFHNNLGAALQEQGKRAEAVASYQRALRLKPDYAEAHYNFGNALREQGKLAEAVASYQRALRLKPDYAEAYSNLGNAWKDQGNLPEAVASYQRAIEIKPDHAEAHNNLGVALREQGKLAEAVASYQRALKLKPDYADAHNNLGVALKEQGKLAEAVASYQRAIEIKPDCLPALGASAHQLQHLCLWDDREGLIRRVIEAVDSKVCPKDAMAITPFSFVALQTPTTSAQQLRCAQQWVERRLKGPRGARRHAAAKRARSDPSKLTIGYLSADFHQHATAWLTAELFEQHDRDRFQVFGYSYGRDDKSAMRKRLAGGFDRFVDIRDDSFAAAAARIAADGVDILIDLKGYTTSARTQILAHRPAPIQVNYLGYPGTMGAEFMDYILVDDFIVPPDQQPFYTEKLVHLPGCYQVNDSRREIAAVTPSRAECGLPEAGFVFCCFNNSYKITPPMFDIWMRLLKRVPGSVLWLLEGNRWVPENLRKEAHTRGVSAERLVFAPRRPLPEHLARQRLADLFLDTFPVNAHTTASDALWAGLPLVTLAGQTFAARVAGSLLRAVNLPELITESLDAYEQLALRLAQNPEELAALRARLAASRDTSALFDGRQFARHVEQAYRRMWEIYTAGESPQAFRIETNEPSVKATCQNEA